jgi:2-polyprenyl-6-methoxyphenol hydroxylase-like FAD-dependent oxidoreductase
LCDSGCVPSVLGDAICSFNPIYGQGMTVAALQAQALGDCLRSGTTDLARRYFRAAAKPIGVAWQFAVGGDLNLPEVEGHRPLAVRLSNMYVERLQTAAESDLTVAEQLTRRRSARPARNASASEDAAPRCPSSAALASGAAGADPDPDVTADMFEYC